MGQTDVHSSAFQLSSPSAGSPIRFKNQHPSPDLFMNDRKSPNPTSLIRVFLFAQYRMEMDSIRHYIDSNRDMAVSSGVCHLDEADISTDAAKAHVGVVHLSHGDHVEIVSQLLHHNPDIRIVVVVKESDLETQAAALDRGAVGIVHENQNPKFLMEAIRRTYEGDTWLNRVLHHKIRNNDKSKGKNSSKAWSEDYVEELTPRELEVIQMIGDGPKNKTLARRLNIREATVRHHLSSIYGKTGVEDRVNLVIFAYQKGLIRKSDNPPEV